MMPIKPPDPEIVSIRRDLAIRELEKCFELVHGFSKWIVTTLLALNGGALIASLNSKEILAIMMDGPGWLFVSGIVASMLSARCVVLGVSSFGSTLQEAIWRNDQYDQASFEEFSLSKIAEKCSKMGRNLIGASATCFVSACLWIGFVLQ